MEVVGCGSLQVCVSLVNLAIPVMSRFLHRAEWSVRLGFGMDEMSAVELDGRAPGGSRPSRSSQGRGAQAASNNAASSVTGLGFACLLPWFLGKKARQFLPQPSTFLMGCCQAVPSNSDDAWFSSWTVPACEVLS